MNKTICLNMIVKNECSAIKNCLDSVRSLIDTWVIVDTGSEDGTQEIVRNCLSDLPGELHERPWVNFAHNRNEALRLALGKADYILFIDADEEMQILDGFDKNKLEKDAYFVPTKGVAADHFRLLLIKSDPRWRWEGALHEYLVHDGAVGEVLETLVNFCQRRDGNRTQNPDKFLEDARLLEKQLEKEGDNSRLIFYLAQSLGNAGEFAKALEQYQKRAALPGPPDEIFWCLYCIGHLQELLERDLSCTLSSFCRAYQFAPKRAEPLERMASDFLRRGWPLLGYLVAHYSLALPKPLAIGSNVHSWVYDYARHYLTAECAYLLGNTTEAHLYFKHLMRVNNLPEPVASHVARRLQ